MNEVLLTNLFFIITGTAILVVAAFLCVALFHLIRIMCAVRAILERVEHGTSMLLADVKTLRDNIVSGAIATRLLALVLSAVKNAQPKRRAPRKRKTSEDSQDA